MSEELRLLARAISLRPVVTFADKPKLLVKWSTNPRWQGKLPKDDGHKAGDGWTNLETTLEDFFTLVSMDGRAIAPELIQDGTRSQKTFASHQIVLVDIDSGMTIEDLLQDEFYQQYAAGYYTTPSHSDALHKFRIIFILDDAMTDAAKLRHLYTGLIRMFGGDQACKDSSRLFYGTINAQRKSFNSSKRLSIDVVETIVEEAQQEEEEHYDRVAQQNYEPPTDEEKRLVLEELKKCYLGEYQTWFRLGCALKNSGYSVQDFIEVSLSATRSKTASKCKSTWNSIKAHNKPATFATLMWFIKENKNG